MNRNIKITVILCLLFVAGVLLGTFLEFADSGPEALSSEELRELGALVYEEPVVLEPFTLTDQRGQSFSEQNLLGKWTLIFFGFTSCPDICPLTLTELDQFYRTLPVETQALDTRVVMVTVDPERDTPEKMADYMLSFNPNFVGLTGPYDDIAALARQLYIAHSPPPVQDPHAGHDMPAVDYQIDHSGNVLIISPDGKYYGFFDAATQDNEFAQAYQAIRAAY